MLFNEPKLLKSDVRRVARDGVVGFSALQRAEIAEIVRVGVRVAVTVTGFSALQRAEIAEIAREAAALASLWRFQCSSTSRNC